MTEISQNKILASPYDATKPESGTDNIAFLQAALLYKAAAEILALLGVSALYASRKPEIDSFIEGLINSAGSLPQKMNQLGVFLAQEIAPQGETDGGQDADQALQKKVMQDEIEELVEAGMTKEEAEQVVYSTRRLAADGTIQQHKRGSESLAEAEDEFADAEDEYWGNEVVLEVLRNIKSRMYNRMP
jgi:hypothetical protein